MSPHEWIYCQQTSFWFCDMYHAVTHQWIRIIHEYPQCITGLWIGCLIWRFFLFSCNVITHWRMNKMAQISQMVNMCVGELVQQISVTRSVPNHYINQRLDRWKQTHFIKIGVKIPIFSVSKMNSKYRLQNPPDHFVRTLMCSFNKLQNLHVLNLSTNPAPSVKIWLLSLHNFIRCQYPTVLQQDSILSFT